MGCLSLVHELLQSGGTNAGDAEGVGDATEEGIVGALLRLEEWQLIISA